MRELALNEIEAVSGGFGEPHEDGGGATGINAWASFSNIQYSAAINTAISFSAAPSVRDLYNEWLDSRASPTPPEDGDINVPGTRLSTEQVMDMMRTWAMYDLLRTYYGEATALEMIEAKSTLSYAPNARNSGSDFAPPTQQQDYTTADGRPFEQQFPPGIYQVEFTPALGSASSGSGSSAGGGEHRQFVYVPADGGPAQVISGNAVNGRLTVIVGSLSGSAHDLNASAGRNSMDVFRLDTGTQNPQTIWNTMTAWGTLINNANLGYNVVTQSSNSVFRTLSDITGLRVDNVGVASGFDNNLSDEVLIVYGGPRG